MHDDAAVASVTGQKERVQEFFDTSTAWQGDFYETKDEYFGRLIQRRKEYAMAMLSRVPNHKGQSALDIGCGAGAYLEELVARGYRSTGVDLSPEMLAASRERLCQSGHDAGQVRLLQGDVEDLPLKDGEFDLVLCIGVLGYLLSDEKALCEIIRVLKPGGHLLLNVTNLYALSDLDFHVRTKMRGLISWRDNQAAPGTALPYASHSDWMMKNRQYANKSYNLRAYERLLGAHGLERIDARTFGYEFRVLRRMHALPRPLLDRTELLLESAFRKLPLPYLSSSGWGYIGLFVRE